MRTAPSHETPLYVVVPASTRPGDAMQHLLSSPQVACHAMPALWVLETAGIDLVAALPKVTSVTLGTLASVVETLLRLATPERLDDLVDRTWRGADEVVRRYHLHRGFLQTLGAIFHRGPRTEDLKPPRAFLRDRIAETAFQIEYRIAPAPGERNVLAPAEEATLALYPFDPSNGAAREELGLGEGAETILEVFAYADGRARQREVLEAVARSVHWRVIDPM